MPHGFKPEIGTNKQQAATTKPWVWWLIIIWTIYLGAMLWHQKQRIGWVASVCSAPQQR